MVKKAGSPLSIYKSSTSIASIPFFLNKSANTPCPDIIFPENEPSYIALTPHDGLLDCKITISAFCSFTVSSALLAPSRNSLSTDVPSLRLTIPFTISAGSLGIGSPPRTSGQTGITSCPLV